MEAMTKIKGEVYTSSPFKLFLFPPEDSYVSLTRCVISNLSFESRLSLHPL
jgi:hypothetical protein